MPRVSACSGKDRTHRDPGLPAHDTLGVTIQVRRPVNGPVVTTRTPENPGPASGPVRPRNFTALLRSGACARERT